MALPIAPTNKNKAQIVNELRQLLSQEPNWRSLLEEFELYHDAPDSMIDASTVYRLLKGDYNLETMRKTTFEKVGWLLEQIKNASYVKQSYAEQLQQSLLNFPPALQRFFNPNSASIQSIAEQMSGEYQGYRLSMAQPGYVSRLHLKITYNQKENVLDTKEKVKNQIAKTREVFEGCCTINLNHTGVRYFLTRIKKGTDISHLLFTVIHDYSFDDTGKINLMKGVVSGNSLRGPFARHVIYERKDTNLKDTIKTDFISESDFLAENPENKSILAALHQPIDVVI